MIIKKIESLDKNLPSNPYKHKEQHQTSKEKHSSHFIRSIQFSVKIKKAQYKKQQIQGNFTFNVK